MAVANTLAYIITATITAVKSFIVQAPEKLYFSKFKKNLKMPLNKQEFNIMCQLFLFNALLSNIFFILLSIPAEVLAAAWDILEIRCVKTTI
jgi:hypothetical protein